jgi:hypothetical protein
MRSVSSIQRLWSNSSTRSWIRIPALTKAHQIRPRGFLQGRPRHCEKGSKCYISDWKPSQWIVILSYLILSYLILSYLILSYLIVSNRFESFRIVSNRIESNRTRFHAWPASNALLPRPVRLIETRRPRLAQTPPSGTYPPRGRYSTDCGVSCVSISRAEDISAERLQSVGHPSMDEEEFDTVPSRHISDVDRPVAE